MQLGHFVSICSFVSKPMAGGNILYKVVCVMICNYSLNYSEFFSSAAVLTHSASFVPARKTALL